MIRLPALRSQTFNARKHTFPFFQPLASFAAHPVPERTVLSDHTQVVLRN